MFFGSQLQFHVGKAHQTDPKTGKFSGLELLVNFSLENLKDSVNYNFETVHPLLNNMSSSLFEKINAT